MTSRVRRWLFGAACVVPPVLVYLNSLGVPFHYDDVHSIVDNPHLRSLTQIPRFFWDPATFSAVPANAMFRPLLLVSFALNYAVSGYHVWSYHLVNVGLHALSTLLLGGIALRLLGGGLPALVAALMFGLHPLNSESVNYISSRSELLAGLWVLLGIWAYIHPERGTGRFLLVTAALILGLLSKSVAIVLPAMLIIVHETWERRRRRFEWHLFAVLAGVCLGYLVVVRHFLATALVGAPVRSYSEQLFTQLKALVFYLNLLIWPSRLSVDHQFLLSTGWDPLVVGSVGLMASLVFVAWRARNQTPLYLLCLGCALVSLAPSSLVPLNVLVNEHRLYLASAFFALAAAAWMQMALAGTPLHSRAGVCVIGAGMVFLGAATVERNAVWNSKLRLWSDAADQAPLMARPQLMLGQALADSGRRKAAVAALRKAIQRDPGFIPAYVELASLYADRGRPAAAETVLVAAISAAAGAPEPWVALGGLMRAQKRWKECARAYARAVELSPADAGLLNNLGNAYQMLGDAVRARRAHERALELDPGDARTWLNLGNADLMAGDLQDAIRAYRRSVALDSSYAAGWVSLGSARERAGQRQEAIKAYLKGARLDTTYAVLAASRARALGGGHD